MPMTRTRPSRPPRYAGEVADLRAFLEKIDCEVTPTVHVNGSAHPSVLLTVDFGSPLKPFRLTPEDHTELTDRLRKTARAVIGREANIRISHDGQNGVFWAGVL